MDLVKANTIRKDAENEVVYMCVYCRMPSLKLVSQDSMTYGVILECGQCGLRLAKFPEGWVRTAHNKHLPRTFPGRRGEHSHS